MLECGYKVSQVSIIHLNKDYVKQGGIQPEQLLEVVDVTKKVNSIYSTVVNENSSEDAFCKGFCHLFVKPPGLTMLKPNLKLLIEFHYK